MSAPKQIAANRRDTQRSGCPLGRLRSCRRQSGLQCQLPHGRPSCHGCVCGQPNGTSLTFIRCREHFRIIPRRADSPRRTFPRPLHHLERLRAKRRAAGPESTQKGQRTAAKSQSQFLPTPIGLPEIGFVLSFCPILDPDSPEPVPSALAPDPAPAETSNPPGLASRHPGAGKLPHQACSPKRLRTRQLAAAARAICFMY
jgi:hypothetical protein